MKVAVKQQNFGFPIVLHTYYSSVVLRSPDFTRQPWIPSDFFNTKEKKGKKKEKKVSEENKSC